MTVLFPNTIYNPNGGRFGLGTITGLPFDGDVSSKFGVKDIAAHSKGHNGTDIAAPSGTPLLAPCDLLITDIFSLAITSTNPMFAQIKKWFGNCIFATIGLQDGTGYRVMFAHLKDPPLVSEGEAVEAGVKIGEVGSTGLSTGAHLHFVLGPMENRWLGRNNGNVEFLDYCASPDDAPEPEDGDDLLKALIEAGAAIEKATKLAIRGR